jgi:uncharacterized RDD family membrane protein YckC
MLRVLAPRNLLFCAACFCIIGCGASSSRQDSKRHHKPGHEFFLEAKDLRGLSEPVPEVRHYKVPKGGYTRHSPLYAKQAVLKDDVLAPLPPQDPSTTVPEVAAEAEQTTVTEAMRKVEEAVADPIEETETPEGMVPPISTTMQCITNLTFQFFVVYTVLFLLQTSTRLGATVMQKEEKNFSSVVETVHLVPMLCVLFMATRMRAVQLTHGTPELYDLPQWWVKAAMQVCTWSMLALTLLVLILSRVHFEAMDAKGQKPPAVLVMLRYIRDLIMVFVYLSFTIVCIGAATMQVPPQLANDAPHEHAALACTLVLTILYFSACLARASATFANRVGLFGEAKRFGNAQELLRNATTTVAFAPMLTVLFIAARIRTMQEADSRTGSKMPRWIQASFYICTVSVLLKTVCVVLTFFLLPDDGGPAARDAASGQLRGAARRRSIARALDFVQLFALAVLYVCVACILIGALLFSEHHLVSAELNCIAALTVLYFGVYLAQQIVQCARKDRGQRLQDQLQERNLIGLLEDCLHDAKAQVQFCPMFCVLFLACLLRALQVTGGSGAPQSWCQTVEYIATAAIAWLLLLCMHKLLPQASAPIAMAFAVSRCICVGVLYAAAMACIYALYTVTPENASRPEGQQAPLTVLLALERHIFGKHA